MTLRINEHPRAMAGMTSLLVIVAATVSWRYALAGQAIPMGKIQSFYTTDDSSPDGALAQLFIASTELQPPFEYEGKMAYRAHVFSTDGGRTRFVGYLERYTPRGKHLLDRLNHDPAALLIDMQGQGLEPEVEIRRPGDGGWVLRHDEVRSARVLDFHSLADGRLSELKTIFP